MAKLQIQNRTRNPYKIPLVKDEIDIGARMVPPGMTAEIDADKHAALMKANRAYGALIEQGRLKVSPIEIEEVTAEELEHTADPEKPADLDDSLETSEGKSVETKTESVEVVEMEVENEAPAAKAPAKKAPAKRAPAKKK